MIDLAGRTTIILVTAAHAFVIAVLVSDSLPFRSPATSFDAVFARLLTDIWSITAIGMALGAVLACRWRRDRVPAARRRDRSLASGSPSC